MKYVEDNTFKNVKEITMTVIPLFQEELIKFYERLGYTFTGQQMEFPEERKKTYFFQVQR